jgi:signal transduction histidine kinase
MTERQGLSALGWLINAPTALVCGVLAFLALLYWGQDVTEQAGTQHLVAAQWQTVESERFAPPPAQLLAGLLPSQWRSSALPLAPSVALLGQAKASLKPKGTQITWIKVPVDSPFVPQGPMALYGARVKTNGTVAVYVNGQLAHTRQLLGAQWNSNRTPLWVELNTTGTQAPIHEVTVRLEHTRQSKVALSSLWLGPTAVLERRHQMRLWLQQEAPMMLNGAFIAVGVFSLGVWFKRRQETPYLLFFFLAATSFARGLHFYASQVIANDWFGWMTVNALFWMVTAVHVFMCQLHAQPLRWLTRTLFGLCAIMGLLTLPLWPWLSTSPAITPLIYVLPAAMSAVVAIVGGIYTWRGSPDGRLVATGVGMCTLFGVGDWLLQNNVINPEGWYLGAYTNALTFMVFGSLIYRRYVMAIEEVRQLNASLAERLKAREAELEISHQQLRQAEMKEALSEERQRLMQDMHGLITDQRHPISGCPGPERAMGVSSPERLPR